MVGVVSDGRARLAALLDERPAVREPRPGDPVGQLGDRPHPVVEHIGELRVALPLAGSVGLQMVTYDDLGHAAAVAIANPEEFVGESIDLAGDERSLAETAEILTEVTGRDVEAVHVPIEDAYETFGEEFTVMCEWFNEVGYSADVPALEARFGFEFSTIEDYLGEAGWADKRGMDSVPGWVKAMA